jgi:DedD protein
LELKLRQRLVGVIVIIALAIIFVPMFFKNTNRMTVNKTLLTTASPADSANTTQIILSDQTNSTPQNNVQSAPTAAPVANNQSQAIAANQAAVLGTQARPVVAKATANPSQVAFGDQPMPVAVDDKANAKQAAKPKLVMAATQKEKPTAATSAQQLSFAQQAVQAEITIATADDVAAPTATAWVVQLGVFSSSENAKKLVAELRAQGFAAFTRIMKMSGNSMVRVFVGPEVRRNKADVLQTKLAHDLHVNGVVVPFDPSQIK